MIPLLVHHHPLKLIIFLTAASQLVSACGRHQTQLACAAQRSAALQALPSGQFQMRLLNQKTSEKEKKDFY